MVTCSAGSCSTGECATVEALREGNWFRGADPVLYLGVGVASRGCSMDECAMIEAQSEGSRSQGNGPRFIPLRALPAGAGLVPAELDFFFFFFNTPEGIASRGWACASGAGLAVVVKSQQCTEHTSMKSQHAQRAPAKNQHARSTPGKAHQRRATSTESIRATSVPAKHQYEEPACTERTSEECRAPQHEEPARTERQHASSTPAQRASTHGAHRRRASEHGAH